MTKRNSSGKRGRPVSEYGAMLRKLGISRLEAWKWKRLLEIPEEQFEVLIKQHHTTDGVLRAAGKLSPDRPRPPERARDEAIALLKLAWQHLDWLEHVLRETGTDEELMHAKESMQAVLSAVLALRGR